MLTLAENGGDYSIIEKLREILNTEDKDKLTLLKRFENDPTWVAGITVRLAKADKAAFDLTVLERTNKINKKRREFEQYEASLPAGQATSAEISKWLFDNWDPKEVGALPGEYFLDQMGVDEYSDKLIFNQLDNLLESGTSHIHDLNDIKKIIRKIQNTADRTKYLIKFGLIEGELPVGETSISSSNKKVSVSSNSKVALRVEQLLKVKLKLEDRENVEGVPEFDRGIRNVTAHFNYHYQNFKDQDYPDDDAFEAASDLVDIDLFGRD